MYKSSLPEKIAVNYNVVIDFADLVSAWLLTLRTLIVNFDGLSQTLKEYSDERKYFDVFLYPITFSLTYKK